MVPFYFDKMFDFFVFLNYVMTCLVDYFLRILIMSFLEKKEIAEGIIAFYNPHDDIEEAVEMLEDIDLSLIDKDVIKPLRVYLFETASNITTDDGRDYFRWRSLALNVCKRIDKMS